MKNILVILVALSLSVFAGNDNHQHGSKNHDMDKSHQSMKKSEGHSMISVPTVQCNSCVKTITTALDKVDGVKSVKIDLEKKMAHVNYDAEKVKLNDIEKAITAAGYDANDLKRDEDAHSTLPSCCQSRR